MDAGPILPATASLPGNSQGRDARGERRGHHAQQLRRAIRAECLPAALFQRGGDAVPFLALELVASQYGGFCAPGVGLNALFPVDLTGWQVCNGKLYLDLNHGILRKSNAEFDGNVVKADKKWPGLVQKNGMQPRRGAHPGIAPGGASHNDQEKVRPS